MTRKTIALDEEVYRQLVKARGKLEMISGRTVSLGEAIGVAAGEVLEGLGVNRILEALEEKEGR